MDEQRLGQVFRDAVEAMPAASFGHNEVVSASRRATARRRGMLAGGTLLGGAVLVGGLVAGGHAVRNDTAGNAAAAPGGQASESGTLRTLDAPRCGPIDPELAADLTALLANRGSVASGPPGEVPERCPAGSRSAAVPVTGGVLYVLLVPQVEPEPVEVATPDGARGYSVTVDGGRTLAVISTPGTPGQPAPLADEVPDLARELAAAL